MQTEFTPAPIPSGRVMVGDSEYMRDGKGGLIPVSMIKPQHLLEDELVRKIIGYAVALSDQVARFKGHLYDDIGGF
jgi:hypothetical protein